MTTNRACERVEPSSQGSLSAALRIGKIIRPRVFVAAETDDIKAIVSPIGQTVVVGMTEPLGDSAPSRKTGSSFDRSFCENQESISTRVLEERHIPTYI